MALKALEEWSDLAIQRERRDTDEDNLSYLQEWDGEMFIPKDGRYMDYDLYWQPKKAKNK